MGFASEFLELVTGGRHEFDAVAADRSVVAGIKASSGLTSGGRNPSGKITACIAELYYLSLVEAEARLLILTNPDFHEIFLRRVGKAIAPGLRVECIQLPVEMQREVDAVVKKASAEVDPSAAQRAAALGVEEPD